jgi:fatty-acyl-CoA synthase
LFVFVEKIDFGFFFYHVFLFFCSFFVMTSQFLSKYGGMMALGSAASVAGVYMWLSSLTDTVGADLLDLLKMLKYKREFDKAAAADMTVADIFEQTLARNPDALCLQFVEAEEERGVKSSKSPSSQKFTFAEVDARANQVAAWALSVGVRPQEVVALMMDNRPEFVFAWLGLVKIGAIVALINTNLRLHPLMHSLNISNAVHFIVGDEHLAAVDSTVRDQVAQQRGSSATCHWYSLGDATTASASSALERIDERVAAMSAARDERQAAARRGMTMQSTLFYIYTSGTTGPPKASVVKHFKFFGAGMVFSRAFNVTSDDKMYCTLPMYHASGGMIGAGSCFYAGCPLVFRRRFSASRFWHDCADFDATVVMYIGELCRYLVKSPPTEADRAHRVRLAVGNGLRPDVWAPFVERFNIAQIGEFYASTEGNASLLNTRNRFGAVGYVSPIIASLFPLKLVKFDVEREEPVRDSRGFCIECGADEPGELLGLIDESDPLRSFHGYTNKAATQKKVMSDVFVKGDRYFRTGDLLKRDASGFFYFVDRIGDTFRWKGENVATSEVAEVVGAAPGVIETNIYGVAVPNQDGRAGMACMVVDKQQFDMASFYQHCRAELPSYARPIFLRMRQQIDVTGTFKHKKRTLVLDGFDPDSVSDPLFYADDRAGAYVPLTPELYRRLCSPQARL